MLKPVFYNQRDLVKYIGGSVLGAVGRYDSPNLLSKRRKNIAVFGVVQFIFFLSAGFLIFLHSQGLFIIEQLKALVM